VLTPDKQNAALAVRQAVPLSDNDADYPAFYVANFLLGGGGDSRLWKRVRERDGLSYSVYSYVEWNRREPHSQWVAGAIFAPTNRAAVEAAIGEEIARALRDGFNAAEVDTGKQALVNFRRLSRAQDERLAAQMVGNLELDRRFAKSQQVDDAIAALKVDEVNAALRKYLRPQAMASALAGDFKP
jgi:zinc protease